MAATANNNNLFVQNAFWMLFYALSKLMNLPENSSNFFLTNSVHSSEKHINAQINFDIDCVYLHAL